MQVALKKIYAIAALIFAIGITEMPGHRIILQLIRYRGRNRFYARGRRFSGYFRQAAAY